MNFLMKIFGTGQDLPVTGTPEEVKKKFNSLRWRVFASITIGYAFYYIIRQGYSVIKKPMLNSGVVTPEQIGIIGTIFFITYGVGKFTNSFLSDRMNNKRFFAFGLFISSITMTCMGLVNSFVPLAVLWGINGWFQSYGAGPSIVSLNQWFSKKEFAPLYGVWFTSHNLGSAFAYFAIAAVVTAYSWQAGFLMAGIVALVGSVFIYLGMSDRPETQGLPNGAVYYGEKTQEEVDAMKNQSVGSMQWNEVVKNPAVWVLGLASLCVYIARYAVESWGPVYLSTVKGYDMMGAAGVMAYMQVAGIFGAMMCGWISDRFFDSRRNIPALIYGMLYTASIAGFVWAPQDFVTDLVCMTFYGFTMGALVCYMGGLMAVDIVPKRVTGAAMGMIGALSYVGASTQEFVTGKLMTVTPILDANGVQMLDQAGKKMMEYNFGAAPTFWVCAALGATLLPILVWNAKAKNDE